MKKAILKVLQVGAILSASGIGPVMAVPMYYTFEGEVSFMSGSFDPADYGIDVQMGQSVSYTFIVDTDLDGYYERDSVQYSLADGNGYDYFYTELVSEELIPEIYYNRYQYHYGTQRDDGTGVQLTGGSLVTIRNAGATGQNANGILSDWTIGTELYAQDYFSIGSVDTGYARYLYESQVVITSICTTLDCGASVSVPEPGTLTVFGLGLLGMGVLRRRRGR
jgi:hypothetical protein